MKFSVWDSFQTKIRRYLAEWLRRASNRVVPIGAKAREVGARKQILSGISNGVFVQFAYEILLGRGAMADEIGLWDLRLSHQDFTRDKLVATLFARRVKEELAQQRTAFVDPELAHVLGTNKFITSREWKERAKATGPCSHVRSPKVFPSLAFERRPEILVSAITSLYKGGDYIEQFLENITSQSIFEPCCELIIIDADSPENEFAVIKRYMERFSNLVYYRAPARIGIYEAWNIAIEMARGSYITNTNLDDKRREDSFERQAEILEKLPYVDVVYQDFLYSFDAKLNFSTIAAIGVQSELPIVTPYNLMRFNSPHNAPMWRRIIHADVGLFDTTYQSAGDHEFWLRCVQAGKIFSKVNDPHVVYFVNPQGMSTRSDTPGVKEGRRVQRMQGRKIISPKLVSSAEEFLSDLSLSLGDKVELSQAERLSADWRYAAVQSALRSCSVSSRTFGNGMD